MFYFPHIDGLRAVAVLSVILFHFEVSLFSGGFVGVDIFFVISGFLISSLIHKELLTTGEFRLSRFYVRRARRLLPSMLTVVGITSLFALFLFPSQQLQSFGVEVIAGLLSVSNFLFWLQSGYFDTAAENKALLHMWSLTVEEQFYLLWPISFVIGYKFLSARFFFIALCLLFLFSLFITIFLTNIELDWFTKQSQGLFFLTPFRVYEFLIGTLGVFLITRVSTKPCIQELMFLAGMIGVICSLSFLNKHSAFPSYVALLPCLSALLIILSSHSKLAKICLANKAAVYIGLLSYTLYLVHWPAIVIAKNITFGELNNTNIIITTIVIIITSLVIYQLIEKPLRTRTGTTIEAGIIKQNSTFLMGCLLTIMTLIIFAVIVIKSSGFQSLKNELYTSEFISKGKSNRYSLLNTACRIDNLQGPNCNLERPVQVLIYGNSHATDGYNIFHQIIKHNENVNLITFGSTNSCDIGIDKHNNITSDVKRKKCSKRAKLLNDDTFLESLDIVVYSSNKPFSSNKLRSWEVLNNLTSRNKSIKTIVVGTYLNTKKECAKIANRYASTDACKKAEYVSYSGFNEQHSTVNQKRTGSMNYIYFDKFSALCNIQNANPTSCTTSAEGEPMLYDRNHLSLSFSLHIGRLFSELYSSELQTLGLKQVSDK